MSTYSLEVRKPYRTPVRVLQPVAVEVGGRTYHLYGNHKLLLGDVAHLSTPAPLDQLEKAAEELVLQGKIMVCGYHNECHQQVAVVPLRFGSPRILILPGGFRQCLGEDLCNEPFRAARLWRYQWDNSTDLAITTRPNSVSWAKRQPALDRLIHAIATDQMLRERLHRAVCEAKG